MHRDVAERVTHELLAFSAELDDALRQFGEFHGEGHSFEAFRQQVARLMGLMHMNFMRPIGHRYKELEVTEPDGPKPVFDARNLANADELRIHVADILRRLESWITDFEGSTHSATMDASEYERFGDGIAELRRQIDAARNFLREHWAEEGAQAN